MTSEDVPLAIQTHIYSVIKKNSRFILGARWLEPLPVRHDILRDEYWIYNEEIEGNFILGGIKTKFFKFAHLPDDNEVNLLEWKVIDSRSEAMLRFANH
jgi:hypothetical protein